MVTVHDLNEIIVPADNEKRQLEIDGEKRFYLGEMDDLKEECVMLRKNEELQLKEKEMQLKEKELQLK